MKGGRSATGAVIALIANAGIAGVLIAAASGAGAATTGFAWGAFTLTATAEGIGLHGYVPGGAASDTLADGAVVRASSALDAVGASTASAAVVAPSEDALTVVELPVNTARQKLDGGPASPPPPTVPLRTTSDASSAPHGDASVGRWQVVANSEDHSSTASAGTSGTPATIESTASVEQRDDLLTAVSTTDISALTVGTVSIGSLHSLARLDTPLGGAQRPTAELTLDGVRAGDIAVDVGPGRSFDNGSVSITVVDAVVRDGAVVSPAVVVRLSVPASFTGTGSTTVTYVVGRAAVTVDANRSTVEPGASAIDDDSPAVTAAPPDGTVASTVGIVTGGEPAPIALDLEGAPPSVAGAGRVARVKRGPLRLTGAGTAAVVIAGLAGATSAGAWYQRRRRTTVP